MRMWTRRMFGGLCWRSRYCAYSRRTDGREWQAFTDERSRQTFPRTIKMCCDKGDELAIETFRKTGEILGLAMANYASIVDPEAIILTGGIAHAGKWLLEQTYDSFEQHVFGNLRGKVKILVSKLNDRERDVLGASALAWSVPEYSLFK